MCARSIHEKYVIILSQFYFFVFGISEFNQIHHPRIIIIDKFILLLHFLERKKNFKVFTACNSLSNQWRVLLYSKCSTQFAKVGSLLSFQVFIQPFFPKGHRLFLERCSICRFAKRFIFTLLH